MPNTEWYANYIRDFMNDDGPAVLDMRIHTVADAGHFYLGGGLNTVKAGSVVLTSSWDLEDRTFMPVAAEFLVGRRQLCSPRLWALLNFSLPLVVINPDGGACTLDWPSTTHHVLYRATWSHRWHEQWLASQALEEQRGGSSWVRALPFGTAFDGGSTARLRAERRPALERRIFFAFRGTGGPGKTQRDDLARAVTDAREWVTRVSERAMRHVTRHPSGVGRFVMDVTPSQNPHYRTMEQISYLELLRDSVFSICPPGDLWETWRTWEAIEAGSIPVLLQLDHVYGTCDRPSEHMAEVAVGAVFVSSWDELPGVLEREAANMTHVGERQRRMLEWLHSYKLEARRELASTVSRMRGKSAPRPASVCSSEKLQPHDLHRQHKYLGSYWRQPQIPQDRTLANQIFSPPLARDFTSARFDTLSNKSLAPFCASSSPQENSLGFVEPCLDQGCGAPLLRVFSCGLKHQTNS